MTATRPPPAILFHPDGYDISEKLMGRQSAGHGFLRAVIEGRGDRPVVGYGVGADLRQGFQRLVGQVDPTAPTRWIPADGDARAMAAMDVCHRADPAIGEQARLRLRYGPAAFSLTGVTHTLSSDKAMQVVADMLHEPLQPWDALICTSRTALEIVQKVHEAQAEYLRWRLGPSVRISGPQLPVIPLGVHAQDFTFSDDDRAAARRSLGIADDEVVVFYAGRLVFHCKAHPYPVFVAMEAVKARTGAPVRLVMFGQAPAPHIATAFTAAAAAFAPNVRVQFLDGRTVPAATAWGCADVFVSMADSVQETFGLTPIEAMMAGIPAVVSDWDGYRETVRDGVDGFRIPTAAPGPGAGEVAARAYEAGSLNFDRYQWLLTASISVDIAALSDRLASLVEQPALRRAMGQAARARALQLFEWKVVYAQHEALWAELAARRHRAATDDGERDHMRNAPKHTAARADPCTIFSHFPTRTIRPETTVRAAAGASLDVLDRLLADPLFTNLLVGRADLAAMWQASVPGDVSVAEMTRAANAHVNVGLRGVGILAKMGLVVFVDD